MVKPGLILAAHGERGGSGDNMLPRLLAARLAAKGCFDEVRIAFIRAEPLLETQSRQMRETDRPVLVYPLFMSNGYFVKVTIPKALGLIKGHKDQQFRILPPAGLSPALPRLLADMAVAALHENNVDPMSASLLLPAHGSTKGPASKLASEAVADGVRKLRCFNNVATGYLEEEPFIASQLASLPTPIAVLGLFIGAGMHGKDDLDAAIATANRAGLIAVTPLARATGFLDLLERDVLRHLA